MKEYKKPGGGKRRNDDGASPVECGTGDKAWTRPESGLSAAGTGSLTNKRRKTLLLKPTFFQRFSSRLKLKRKIYLEDYGRSGKPTLLGPKLGSRFKLN